MLLKMYIKASPYLACFLFFSTIGFLVLAAYRGELLITSASTKTVKVVIKSEASSVVSCTEINSEQTNETKN